MPCHKHGDHPGNDVPPDAADFPDIFARAGWDAIEAECRAHRTTIKRWMIDFGEADLIRRRREYLEAKYSARGHRIGGVRPGRKLATA